jgi:hypothetical protein
MISSHYLIQLVFINFLNLLFTNNLLRVVGGHHSKQALIISLVENNMIQIDNVKNGHKVPVPIDIINDIPKYSYKQIIPKKYIKNDKLHDILVAASLLHHANYITTWQLQQVANWVKKQNNNKLFEAVKTCKLISNKI